MVICRMRVLTHSLHTYIFHVMAVCLVCVLTHSLRAYKLQVMAVCHTCVLTRSTLACTFRAVTVCHLREPLYHQRNINNNWARPSGAISHSVSIHTNIFCWCVSACVLLTKRRHYDKVGSCVRVRARACACVCASDSLAITPLWVRVNLGSKTFSVFFIHIMALCDRDHILASSSH